jgi:uncharacterized protein
MDQAFAPPTERWMRVSPKLRTVRRLVLLASAVPAGLIITVVLILTLGATAGILAAIGAAALIAWGWWLIGRNWMSWGYAERADDLLVTSGFMFRRLVVVPYGRMQFVDVTAGPLERRFGISTVQLHTATQATDASIPGLPDADAARLRDRLAALGEARSAGL